MRTTTIIAPRLSAAKLAPRATPRSNAIRSIGIGAALLIFGLIYLVVSPVGWILRKLGVGRSGPI